VVDSELTIGVLSRRIPIALNDQAGPVLEHVGGLTRVLPALAEFAKINWSAVTDSKQAAFPNQISYTEVSGQNLSNEINICLAAVSGDDLHQSDWFCAQYLWPLLHDLPIPALDIAELNASFSSIKRLSLEMATKCIDGSNDGYLVNDFQLSQVPLALRELAPDQSIVFFLHTPWPKEIPSNRSALNTLKFIATGMLAADVIQFQTHKDLEAFEVFVGQHLLPENISEKLRVNPVSVNVPELIELSAGNVNSNGIDETDVSYLHIARSDPIKNTLATIKAFTTFLTDSTTKRPQTFLDLFIVPSRQQWPEYQSLLLEITSCVNECNSKLAQLDYAPIRLHLGSDYQQVIQAFVRYDYLIACSISDGLNLVIKEGAILNNRNGVIISSQNVGAMTELGSYCVVAENVDDESIAMALHSTANLDFETRQAMSLELKAQITQFDASHWAQAVVANFRILEKV
jgi:trehalose 6-phosphate synthase